MRVMEDDQLADLDVDVAILGAGSAGLVAYREVLKSTSRVALIDGGALGTTCARVGCMPSKLLIAAAEAYHKTQHLAEFGIKAERGTVDGVAVMKRVRSERDRFVGFVLESIDGFDQDHIIRSNARFEADNLLRLEDGRSISAGVVVIATGGRAFVPPPLKPADDRLILNDDVFAWQSLPESVAVFGAGVIGLELGQALHRLGVRIRLFGRDHAVGPLSDPEVHSYAAKTFQGEFDAHWHADTEITKEGDTVRVKWNDDNGNGDETFDYLLAATGRRANVDGIGLENTSLARDGRGVPEFDPLSMRAGESSIFIAGDAQVDRAILHEAAHEGRVAGRNAIAFPDSQRYARPVPLAIVFSDPQIAIAGQSHKELTESGIPFETGDVSFEEQGRARVMLANKGLLHVYGEVGTGRLLGAEMIGPSCEHLGHLLAWAIGGNLTVSQILELPFYHPVVEEGLRSALRSLNYRLGFGANPPPRCIDCGPGG